MASRWKQFYEKQMEDEKLRELVEAELENLQLGVQIAKLRAAENLSQSKLAAKAERSAPKISAMENEPRNLAIGTLIHVAHALGSPSRLRVNRVEIKLVRRKGAKLGRRNGGGKSKPAAFETEGCSTRLELLRTTTPNLGEQRKMPP